MFLKWTVFHTQWLRFIFHREGIKRYMLSPHHPACDASRSKRQRTWRTVPSSALLRLTNFLRITLIFSVSRATYVPLSEQWTVSLWTLTMLSCEWTKKLHNLLFSRVFRAIMMVGTKRTWSFVMFFKRSKQCQSWQHTDSWWFFLLFNDAVSTQSI
jgi:hypothetical protein